MWIDWWNGFCSSGQDTYRQPGLSMNRVGCKATGGKTCPSNRPINPPLAPSSILPWSLHAIQKATDLNMPSSACSKVMLLLYVGLLVHAHKHEQMSPRKDPQTTRSWNDESPRPSRSMASHPDLVKLPKPIIPCGLPETHPLSLITGLQAYDFSNI